MKKIFFGAFALLLAGLVLFGCLGEEAAPTATPTPVPTIAASATPSVSDEPPGPPEDLDGGDEIPTLDDDLLNVSDDMPEDLGELD